MEIDVQTHQHITESFDTKGGRNNNGSWRNDAHNHTKWLQMVS